MGAKYYPEIRRILAGNVVRDDDGIIHASEVNYKPHINLDYYGSFNGASSVKLYGLSIRAQEFTIGGNLKAAVNSCYEQLNSMGAPVKIEEPQNNDGVMIWRYMLNPVLLCIRFDGKKLILTAFTARTPFGQFACLRMMNKFYKPLKDILDVGEGGYLRDRDKKEKISRQERKEAKEKKREEKKAAKAEKAKEHQEEDTETEKASESPASANSETGSSQSRQQPSQPRARHGQTRSSSYKGKHSK